MILLNRVNKESYALHPVPGITTYSTRSNTHSSQVLVISQVMEGPPPLNNVAQNLQSHVDNSSTQDTRGNKDSIFLHIQMNTSYMPRSVKAVFEENIQLLPRVQTNQARQVRDAVRKFIYPHIKLLNHKDKEKKERALDRLDNH